ncbi:ATP-binding protein [uncultured Pseudacidovorax sp.]|uniref:ATP-binding protein n=1 Tax=uncultured Pseudacidovorax sp. TaxID=679313 RepID=UPI0025F2E203|nr:ATP-binding protein [uncultured Pseudacidovorax sp.]
MQRLDDARRTPPADDAPGWQDTPLPDAVDGRPGGTPPGAYWYRARFDGPHAGEAAGSGGWALYLPYLYDGGQVWLNGAQVGEIAESVGRRRVRWERPHLLRLPPSLLRSDAPNQLEIRAAVSSARAVHRFPRIQIGPAQTLLPIHDRRLFWVRTTPQVTAFVCALTAGFVLIIWWRRRSEVLYGLFGVAAALWGLRTLTFVIETLPEGAWLHWRALYLAATGGFIAVLALFAMRLARVDWPWARRGLLAYGLIGPACVLINPASEPLVNRVWSAGLIPIGLVAIALAIRTVSLQRRMASAVLPAAMLLAVAAGVHDYFISWSTQARPPLWPGWFEQRIFLLHHAANLLLLAMGSLLTARFIHAMDGLEDLNRTLESRVADRERRIAADFERLARLQRHSAATEERQAIMREIHDGLGSRLFTSLSRVERGDMDDAQMAEVLRACIADMRIALDALAPEDGDFRTALGNFLFRWQGQLEELHFQPSWRIEVPESEVPVLRSPQAMLQLLRIAQEALTNVVKHARPGHVRVALRQTDGALLLEVEDEGPRLRVPAAHRADCAALASGRGIDNMRARARQLGGTLDVRHGEAGTQVRLHLPAPPLATDLRPSA